MKCGLRCIVAGALIGCCSAAFSQAADSPSVTVRSFKVTGNSLLSSEQLDAVTRPYLGSTTLDGMKQAAQAVQTAYRDAGYGAVAAFLPEQSPPDGQFTISVVEGRISRISVSGAQQFSEANVLSSLPALAVGSTPRVREIDRQIRLANENPAKKIEVLLQPGKESGDVEANLQLKEAPVSRWSLGLDNTGNEATGRLRASIGYRHAALFGLDHVLALQYQTAPENPSDVTVVSANYRIPLYALALAIDAYAAYSDVDGGTTSTVAGPLQFSGRGRIAGLRLTNFLPRIGEFDQRISLSLDNRDYLNNCSIVGLPPGACGVAGESVSVQPLAIDYVLQKGGAEALGGSIGLVHNLHLGGSHGEVARFEAIRPGARRAYTIVRASFFAGVALPEQWQLQAHVNGQYTDDALVPGEQFGIGGSQSVRGYDEREVTGDRGLGGSIELFSPDLASRFGIDGGTLRGLAFVDFGWVGNRRQTQCRTGRSECRLVAVGFGVRHVAGSLQLRFDIGHALEPGNRTGRHDTAAHFSVIYSF